MSHILAVVQRGKEHDFPRRSAIRDVHANVHHRLVVQARALPLAADFRDLTTPAAIAP